MILVDHSEPEELISLLRQSTPVTVMPLNQTKRSDYYFGGEDGKTRQFNRVQAGELLANIDSMEDELRRYYESADENYQVIEGIISSEPLRLLTDRQLAALRSGKLKISQLHVPPKSAKVTGKAPNPSISVRMFPSYSEEGLYGCSVEPVVSHEGVIGAIRSEHRYRVSSSMLFSWIFQLAQAGIVTYYTINWVDTAKLLAAIYNNCQKPPEEHTTLNRYYIPLLDTGERDGEGRKISIKEQNPFIKALMALSLAYQIGIGEDKATKLAKQYGSILDIAMAEIGEICQVEGIGKKVAEKLLSAIGREL